MESLKHIGVFTVYDSPGYSSEEVAFWLKKGHRLECLPGVGNAVEVKNLMMATQKLLMAQAVYPTIDRLIITRQTDPPSDTETTYSDVLYETVPGDESLRSPDTNPYQVFWAIPTSVANGNWGSVVLVNSAGDMINRALAGITKGSGQGKIVAFTGTVV